MPSGLYDDSRLLNNCGAIASPAFSVHLVKAVDIGWKVSPEELV
jgi:hypothetical protein